MLNTYILKLAWKNEKIVNKFKEGAAEHNNLLKLSENKSNMVLNYLNGIMEEIISTKKKVECCSQDVINLIKKKTSEIVDIIDKETNSLLKDIELFQRSKEELKKNIENCQDDINKIAVASLEVYHKFIKNNEEIVNTKVAFDKWLPIASEINKKYISPSMEDVYKFIDNIKEYTTDFEKNLSLAEYKIFFTESSILKQARYKSLLVNWIIEAIGKPNFSSKLLWKGTVHGFGASIFHKNCDDKGRTVTVVLSERDYIFGGYTSKPWSSSTGYVDDPEAFIFSLTHKTKHSKQRYKQYSTYRYSSYGPTFGYGYDLHIANNCNANNNSYSKCNEVYELPSWVNSQTYLAGAGSFKVKEIEVYSITI